MEALTAYFIIRYFNFPALQGELCPRLFSQNRPFSGGRAGTEPGPCIKSAKGTPGFLAPFLYGETELNAIITEMDETVSRRTPTI